ncbi:MAG: hypothetical protein ACYYK0_00795 [Candidatus Eutrophobiaceae bacterium]
MQFSESLNIYQDFSERSTRIAYLLGVFRAGSIGLGVPCRGESPHNAQMLAWLGNEDFQRRAFNALKQVRLKGSMLIIISGTGHQE